jgi:hypothetical protein
MRDPGVNPECFNAPRCLAGRRHSAPCQRCRALVCSSFVQPLESGEHILRFVDFSLLRVYTAELVTRRAQTGIVLDGLLELLSGRTELFRIDQEFPSSKSESP